MGIGHILPCETHQAQDQAIDGEGSSSKQLEGDQTQVEPSSTQEESSSTQDEPPSTTQVEHTSQEENHFQEQAPSRQPLELLQEEEQVDHIPQDQAQVEPQEQEHLKGEFVDYKGITRSIKATKKASGMQVNKILGSISKGVLTRRKLNHLANFSKHHSFISRFEPLKVCEALQDPDWIMAMQEELECFTLNEVWSLVEKPKDHRINVIGTKWVFKNKQDEN